MTTMVALDIGGSLIDNNFFEAGSAGTVLTVGHHSGLTVNAEIFLA